MRTREENENKKNNDSIEDRTRDLLWVRETSYR